MHVPDVVKLEGPNMGNQFRVFFVGLWACAVGCTAITSLAADKPNIVLVMADDLGIGDISPTNTND